MDQQYKVGILIPTTTNKRDWRELNQTTFYNVFLKSFLTTYCQNHFTRKTHKIYKNYEKY